ncbi:hypothetical protein D9M68_712970 [compost metagenome]
MFRHKGKRRTNIHNLRLASILSFIAGIVNVCGVLSINILTTNVTGHFAYFAEEIGKESFKSAFAFLAFIFFFFLGAFFSSMIMESISRIRSSLSHAIPLIIEIIIITTIGCFADRYNWISLYGKAIVCALLFAMGMQNALVTKVSRARVRTTHLTGLFTDLGIELSQLFFYKPGAYRSQLSNSILLRIIIIVFFFLGCAIGGVLYSFLVMKTLLLAAICLVIALCYDLIRFQFYTLRRRLF